MAEERSTRISDLVVAELVECQPEPSDQITTEPLVENNVCEDSVYGIMISSDTERQPPYGRVDVNTNTIRDNTIRDNTIRDNTIRRNDEPSE